MSRLQVESTQKHEFEPVDSLPPPSTCSVPAPIALIALLCLVVVVSVAVGFDVLVK